MRNNLRTLALAIALPAAATAAYASPIDTITATNTPDGTVTLDLPSMPTPSSFTLDTFTLNNVTITIDGNTTVADITFNDLIAGGGGSGNGTTVNGDVLFSGLTSAPTLTLGTFNVGGFPVTITGPSVSAVPEPSSLVLLGTGALGLLGACKRRFVAAK